LDIRGIKDIRLISRPIHATSHELEATYTNTPPTRVISKRIFVELLDIREENVILDLWGVNPLAYFSLGLIWPRWRQVVAQILWPLPEAAVTVLCTPDDGCDGHPKLLE
jgi:hypothetical protein